MADRVAVSCIVATLAFWAYTQTLVPGVDLGDTGGFQAAVLWPDVSARQSYPLYYGLARPFVGAVGAANPARALNLFSAIWAAVAVGLLTFSCASVTRSLAGGVTAGLLLAFSYTFWTQAVIAEVYTLHLAFVALCLVALHAYQAAPTTPRLVLFFAVYALSFGNHLSMILLLVPFGAFLVLASPTPRTLFRPTVVGLAVAIAFIGALQYWPNLAALWTSPEAPDGIRDRLAAFWFDVTKADWRESMVLGVRGDQAADRLAMWWFDARQQFGLAGFALAAAGAVGLVRHWPSWAVLIISAYVVSTAFALTYNVGDTHVFLLPGHLVTAFCGGVAVAWITRSADATRRPVILALAVAAIGYAGWRGWTTWPAVDRHDDRRGETLVARLALGVTERDSLLVTHMNWQLENVLLYVGRYGRADLAWVRLGDVLLHWPWLVADNRRIGRDIVLGAEAAAEVVAAYGPVFPIVEDGGVSDPPLPQLAAQVPRGTPYVMTVLTPPREEFLDREALEQAMSALTGGRLPTRMPGAYEVMAGVSGEPPQLYRASERPFRERFRILEERFTVRMDSWLPVDTFRRSGFGHVLHGRDHILIVERGVSLVWLGQDRRPSQPHYAASLFAAKPRYRVLGATPELAREQAPGTRPRAPEAPEASIADGLGPVP